MIRSSGGVKRVFVALKPEINRPLKRLASDKAKLGKPQVAVAPLQTFEAATDAAAAPASPAIEKAALGALSVTAPTISEGDQQRLKTLVCAAPSVEPDSQDEDDDVPLQNCTANLQKEEQEQEHEQEERSEQDQMEAMLSFDLETFEIQQKKEKLASIDPNFIASQVAIDEGMRRVLLDWLSEVVSEYKMASDCLFLAKNYIDRYLCGRQVPKNELQLLGATALLIAAKLEEIQPLGIDDFVFLCAHLYSRETFIMMERKLLSALSFELFVPHEKFFLRCYQRISANDEYMVRHTIELTTWLSSYILELSVLLVEMTKFKPSVIAAACMCIARAAYGIPAWSKTLEKISKISWDDQELKTCCSHLLRFYSDSNATQHCAVRKKYNSEAFAYVSRFPIPVRIPALTSTSLR